MGYIRVLHIKLLRIMVDTSVESEVGRGSTFTITLPVS
jgi:hypothetical protein